ncbi:hypothetical protein Tco_1450303 [Tanacetum coccineum]
MTTNGNNTNELLAQLSSRLGITCNTNLAHNVNNCSSENGTSTVLVAHYANPSYTLPTGPLGFIQAGVLGSSFATAQPVNLFIGPHDFIQLVQSTVQYQPALPIGFVQFQPTQPMGPDVFQQAQPISYVGQPPAQPGHTGPMVTSGQETTLPHAFSTMSLQDPTTSA